MSKQSKFSMLSTFCIGIYVVYYIVIVCIVVLYVAVCTMYIAVAIVRPVCVVYMSVIYIASSSSKEKRLV